MFCKVTETITGKTPKGIRYLNKGEIIEVISGWSFMRCKLSNGTTVHISENDFIYRCREYKFIEEKEFQL